VTCEDLLWSVAIDRLRKKLGSRAIAAWAKSGILRKTKYGEPPPDREKQKNKTVGAYTYERSAIDCRSKTQNSIESEVSIIDFSE
jgi:hypothetical protein